MSQSLLVLPQPPLLPLNLSRSVGIVVLGQVRDEKLIRITSFVANVLVVIKDGVKIVQAFRGQQANGRNHVSHGSSGKGAAGEANKNDGVAVDVVGAHEIVNFADILIEAHTEGAAGELINAVGGAYAGEVVDDLMGSIAAGPAKHTRDAGYI